MSVRVVDLNNEEVKEEQPPIEQVGDFLNSKSVGVKQIEEETKEKSEPIVDTTNEVVEETREEKTEEIKENVKEQPKRQTQRDRINCPRCFKEMSVKSYKYSHEQKCQGQLQDRPVKPHAKPKAKQTKPKQPPKPPPEVYYSDSEEEEEVLQPVIKKKVKQPQPVNSVNVLAQQYQLLQQQMMQQKQERYNKICQGMFAPRPRKR